jgi:hypothetical protein
LAIDFEIVSAWNETHSHLSINSVRAVELAAELTQLQAAAQAAQRRITMDTVPYDFRTALLQSRRVDVV